MKTSAKRVELAPAPVQRRSAYKTLEGWALGILLEEHAIRECEEHGHIRDRTDPEAWNWAREVARHHPFPGTSPEVSVAAIDNVLRSIGDTCPGCD